MFPNSQKIIYDLITYKEQLVVMVGPIHYRKTDPNGLGRGPGYYWYRGKIKQTIGTTGKGKPRSYSKAGYWSKKDDKLDKKRKHKIGSGRYKHVDDRRDKKARTRGTIRPKKPLGRKAPAYLHGSKTTKQKARMKPKGRKR